MLRLFAFVEQCQDLHVKPTYTSDISWLFGHLLAIALEDRAHWLVAEWAQ